jgi:hypothetical protein
MQNTGEIVARTVETMSEDIAANVLRDGSIGEFLRSYQLSISHLISQAPVINISPNRTVPLNDTSIILAHNAYNSLSSGSLMPKPSSKFNRAIESRCKGGRVRCVLG